ncbi:MAG: hypothetical protein RQ806_09405, partial [Erythrobacter sp.]|nr:hypothetical protein [Erythrobacter sp.]
MKEPLASSAPVHPAQMPIAAVLGFSDRGDVDWARLRGLQYSALAKLAFYRIIMQSLLALFVFQIFA